MLDLLDTAHLVIGLTPLVIYLLVLSAVNLLTRPVMVSGTRDLAALAAGLSGLVMIGPVLLFTSPDILARLGPYYWLLLVLLYASSVSLWILFLRPRLVVYNISGEQLRGIVNEIALRIDPASRWAGNALEMPQAGLLLKLDVLGVFGNVSLIADSDPINFASWKRLSAELSAALAHVRVMRNPRGVTIGMLGMVLGAYLIVRWSQDVQAADGFIRFLGL